MRETPTEVAPPDRPPVIAITCDVADDGARTLARSSLAYCDAVARAGGVPILLAPVPSLVRAQLDACHAVLLTGGDDPRTEPFGVPTHPRASPLHPRRQEYESALIEAILAGPRTPSPTPVLGVCLGMQLLALHAGGRLNQHLPDTHPTSPQHAANSTHHIDSLVPDLLPPGPVVSSHHQAVSDPGRLRVIARAHDGVIEAIDDPARPFFLAVQWHPERSGDGPLGLGLIRKLVLAAQRAAASRR